MAGYLKRYIADNSEKYKDENGNPIPEPEDKKRERLKGKYRVLADYDLSKNDFIRDEYGNLDPSFDDYYLKCNNGVKIRHYGGSTLFAYIPSKGKGRNILRQIYKDKIGELKDINDIEKIHNDLIKNGIVSFIEELDSEVEFRFNAKDIDYFATLLKAQTSGASISPFATSNLPKKKYIIPTEDLFLYEEIIKDISKNEYLKLAYITKQFDEVIQKKKGKKYDINAERKLSCLKNKEFIHKIKLWKEYIEFLRNNLD